MLRALSRHRIGKVRKGRLPVGIVTRLRPSGLGHSLGGPARALVPLLVLAALIAVAALSADPSRAQNSVTLISNMGKSDHAAMGAMASQAFTTGSDGPEYVITDVSIKLGWAGSSRNIRLWIFTVGEDGLPETKLYKLKIPDYLQPNGTNKFEAPEGARLKKDTAYTVVIAGNTLKTLPDRDFYHTTATGEDEGGATGWSIADNQYIRSVISEDWRRPLNPSVVKMRIQGYAYTPSDDATLESLKLEDASDDSPISLDPGYTSFTYSALATNEVDTITIWATPNHSGASVAYYDPSTFDEDNWLGTLIPDADDEKDGHQVAISPGANEFRVVVTAEDGNRAAPHYVQVWRELYEPTTGLVSNTGQKRQGGTRVGNNHAGAVSPEEVWSVAQQFRTGDNPGGYALTNVVAGLMNVGADSTPKVSIYTHASGGPGASLYVLTNPATFASLATNTFTAPASATLDANTRYWIVFENENEAVGYDNQYYLGSTVFDREDPGAASGWTIGNGHMRAADGGSWSSTHTYPWTLLVAVEGAAERQMRGRSGRGVPRQSPLTATFLNPPASHDGVNAYTLRIEFNQEVEISPNDLRDHALAARGGTVRCVKRVDDSKDLFDVDVSPDGDGPVTVSLGPTPTDCTARGAVCTANGVSLAMPVAANVPGPSTRRSRSVNSAATGAPSISGVARVGETLTADTSNIADADGLTNVSYDYQWISNDGSADSADIADATGSTYTLVDADQGKTIKVQVNFTDDGGNAETLTSAATGAVAAAANSAATGAPSISGVARVGETLTADTSNIADADGLTNVSYAYQWISNDGSADLEITDANGSAYTLQDADQGKTIKVEVSFTDDRGNAETLTSAATATVALPLLTVKLEKPAASHDGSSEFTFHIRFSENFPLGFKTLRNHAFEVTNGDITKARRKLESSSILWKMVVEPDSSSDVTIVLPATTDCTAQGAICTADGRKLSNSLDFTVPGPQ